MVSFGGRENGTEMKGNDFKGEGMMGGSTVSIIGIAIVFRTLAHIFICRICKGGVHSQTEDGDWRTEGVHGKHI